MKAIREIIKTKLSFRKSKFMRNLQVQEILQKHSDRQDNLIETLERRLEKKDAEAKKETKSLIWHFGEE